MLSLTSIQNTVMQVAEAITAALDIETEIVDSQLRIIGGTGRYVKKIGSLEEEGQLESGFIYASILRTGREYVCMDVRKDAPSKWKTRLSASSDLLPSPPNNKKKCQPEATHI
jgi:hypothetical protein